MTLEEIEAGRSEKGGFTKAQLAKWGVPWPRVVRCEGDEAGTLRLREEPKCNLIASLCAVKFCPAMRRRSGHVVSLTTHGLFQTSIVPFMANGFARSLARSSGAASGIPASTLTGAHQATSV